MLVGTIPVQSSLAGIPKQKQLLVWMSESAYAVEGRERSY